MKFVKKTNVQAIFLLELFAIFCLGYWGFHSSANVVVRIILGIGIPVLYIKLWADYLAPKAKKRIEVSNARIIARLALFSLAALALAINGPFTIAVVFEVAVAVNTILAIAWEQ